MKSASGLPETLLSRYRPSARAGSKSIKNYIFNSAATVLKRIRLFVNIDIIPTWFDNWTTETFPYPIILNVFKHLSVITLT